MIVLYTDFGVEGPYQGQVKGVLARMAPKETVVDLMADAPRCRPREAAYLLAALAPEFPAGSIFLAVVDPGVGGARPAVAVRMAGRWFVGPGNGLFEPLARRWGVEKSYEIAPAPDQRVSASFHGRDLFAPVAARLAMGLRGDEAGLQPGAMPRLPDWPDDLAVALYEDRFGNVMTGLRAQSLPEGAQLRVGGTLLSRGRTFSDRAPGQAFWYENSCGLAEIAVNLGSAARQLGVSVGDEVEVL